MSECHVPLRPQVRGSLVGTSESCPIWSEDEEPHQLGVGNDNRHGISLEQSNSLNMRYLYWLHKLELLVNIDSH